MCTGITLCWDPSQKFYRGLRYFSERDQLTLVILRPTLLRNTKSRGSNSTPTCCSSSSRRSYNTRSGWTLYDTKRKHHRNQLGLFNVSSVQKKNIQNVASMFKSINQLQPCRVLF